MFPLAFPHIPNLDVAGVIAEVGEGVSGWRAGDAVVAFLPMAAPGAAAEYVAAPAGVLAAAPRTVELADAAALAPPVDSRTMSNGPSMSVTARHRGGTQFAQAAAAFRGRGDRGDLGACRCRQLGHVVAYAAGRSGEQDPPAGDVPGHSQQPQGGQAGERQRSSVDRWDLHGQLGQRGNRNSSVLGLPIPFPCTRGH